MSRKKSSSRLGKVSLVATLASTLLSHGAIAKIPTTAFNGVSRCFKPGKEHIDPVIGEAGLEAHLVDTYRFLGNFTPFRDENGHQHAKDISNGDPIWDMVRIFLPSPAGQLNPESTRETNFGNNAEVKTVALLHNYFNDLREGNTVDDNQVTESIFASLKPRLLDTTEEETKRATLTTSLNDIKLDKPSELNKKIQEILKDESDVDLKKAINTASQAKVEILQPEQLTAVKDNMVKDLNTDEHADLMKTLSEIKARTIKELNTKITEILKNEKDTSLKKNISKAKDETLQHIQLAAVKNNMVDALNTYLNNKIQLKETKFKKDEEKFKTNFLEETLNPLLHAIQGAIKGEKDSIYPKFTPELVLSSFFCSKFNTQQDIIDLLENLDDSIVDKSKIPQIRELKEDDLPDIAKRSTYTMDDILALETADIWKLLVPYRDVSAPLSNGNTYKYDRLKDRYLTAEGPLADCAEIAERHLCNMLLYRPLTKDWDLSHIKNHIKTNDPDNKYFGNFEKFYKAQHPSLSNSGDIKIRSLWNKVVGDLNAYHEGSQIVYVQKRNELETGHINIIRVFEKIFSLGLKPFPTLNPDKGKEKENFAAKKKWLQESYETLFVTMNPTKAYKIGLSALKETEGELSGSIFITVSDKTTKEELFSFSLLSNYKKHSEIQDLRTLKDLGIKDYTDDLTTHQSLIQENTAAEVLWMLSSNAELKAQKIHHPLYTLFDQELEDNNSKIRFLEMLSKNFDDLKNKLFQTPGKLTAFKNMLGNILDDFSWNDWNAVMDVSPVIFSLLNKELFDDVLARTVKRVAFEEVTEESIIGDIIQKLEGLDGLVIRKQPIKNFSFLKAAHPNLKTINAAESSIETLEGMEKLPNLNRLSLASVKNFKSVGLSTPHTGLKSLDLSSSTLKELSGLEVFENLEILNLSKTKSLQTLTFKEQNLQLKKINLEESGILEINDLGNCPNLEVLSLAPVNQESTLQHLSINGPLNKLTELDLSSARELTTLKGLNGPNLKEINLNSYALEELVFEKPMPGLEILSSRGGLKKIVGLDHCPNLKTLSLASAFLDLEINEVHENLRFISLDNVYVGISTFSKLLEKSPNLGVLYMKEVHDLDKLSFNNRHDALTVIQIIFSKLGGIEGLDNCPNLETIYLQGVVFKKLAFKTKHEKLREISLHEGPRHSPGYLYSLEGIDNCPNLKNLTLPGTYYSGTSITFEKDNKDLVIKGVRKNQIKGIEHLDEKNIL